MSIQVKRRRGNTAGMAAFTGAAGELAVNTDNNRLHVHDGSTANGHPLALQTDITVNCVDSSTTAGVITVASNVGPTAPADGMVLSILVGATSTGSVTINYNGSGAKSLLSGTAAALVAGAVQAGQQILAQYVAATTNYRLLARDGGNPQFAAPIPITQGGTGANTAAGAVANLGLAEALVFGGNWNASTNSPAFTSGTGSPGVTYVVSVAGTTTLDGISSWNVGDKAVFNGLSNTWNKIDGLGNEVTSVAGRTGTVTLTTADVANAAALNAAQTFTKTQSATVQSLTYASTITFDTSAGNDAVVTLTGNVTFANPSVMNVGASGHIEIIQDSTGGRTASFGTYFKFGAAGTPTLSTAANAIDVLVYWVMDSGRIVCALINGVQ
jgi:hypothetical protein